MGSQVKRLSYDEIEDEMENAIMPFSPTPLTNEQLSALRAAAQRTGRPLTAAEHDAVLHEILPQKFSLGIPLQREKNTEAEHIALREKLLA